jgi:predicted NUDIX family phosphoesterase
LGIINKKFTIVKENVNKMIDYELVVNNLITQLNVKNEAEIANKLGMSRQSLQNHKTRNTIPYKQIISYCLLNKKDINIIFNNKLDEKNNINNNNLKGLNIIGNNNNVSNKNDEEELINKYKKLPKKRQDYYYHMISADILNMEE